MQSGWCEPPWAAAVFNPPAAEAAGGTAPDAPGTYREAMESADAEQWRAAMRQEFDACVAQETWSLVPRRDLPQGANVLPVKWVFKKKFDENGKLEKFKARITPKGFRQKHGIDYHEVFANTGKYKTMRIVLALAAALDLELNQLDVPTAFVRAPLDEEVYMELPEGFEEPGMVCKLNRSLYGLKQAPRNWNLLLTAFILNEMGWRACVSDPCLFYKRSRTGRLMLLFVFVDDMQGAYDRADAAEWAEAKAMLTARFETKDLGDSTWMLGMRITRDRAARTIKLDQTQYINETLKIYNMAEVRTARTPAEVNNGAQEDDRDGGDKPADVKEYQAIVGKLLYAAISTRPDIAYATQMLTRHMQKPLRRHVTAAERVLRYLAGTREKGLLFGRRHCPDGSVSVSAFADADWGSDRSNRKSVSGWIASVNGDPVSWASKKQSCVSLSTCEAEIYAAGAAVQELLWLRGLLQELGVPQFDESGDSRRDAAGGAAAVLYGDNQSAIAVAKTGVKRERTKHIDIRWHFITDEVARGHVNLQWIPTERQEADLLTKALHAPQFALLRDKMMA